MPPPSQLVGLERHYTMGLLRDRLVVIANLVLIAVRSLKGDALQKKLEKLDTEHRFASALLTKLEKEDG